MPKLQPKKKLGPFSLWVWGVIALGAVGAFYLWRKHASAADDSYGSTAVLTTGVLPQQTAAGGYPSSNAAPSSSLSSETLSAIQGRFSDVEGDIATLAAGQRQIATDFQTQATAVAASQQELGNAVQTGYTDLAAQIAGLLTTTFQPPAVAGVNATPTPHEVTIRVVQQSAAKPKPTTKTAKAKPKKAVTVTKAKAPKKPAAKPKPKPKPKTKVVRR